MAICKTHVTLVRTIILTIVVAASSLFNPTGSLADDNLTDALKAVQSVQLNGQGNLSAVKAMRTLNSASMDQLPLILEAMDGANQISQNWLRSAIVSIAGRGGELPRADIQSYLADQSHSPMGRLVAFNLLTNGDEALANRMIPAMVDDTSMPLRHKAIAALIAQAESATESDAVAAIGLFGHALNKARDVAQITTIAKKLDDLGIKIDLQSQLGFLSSWHLVGCFENENMGGFDVPFGPEEALGMIDLNASYQDQNGKPTSWQQITTNHETGNVNINDLIGTVKGATVYAFGTFKAMEDQTGEFRVGTANATKIWLNGELVMSNEIYHNSNSIDKFIASIKLNKGENQILIKICQNEQNESWAQDWQFQIRVCDPTGKAIAPEPVVEATQ